MKINSIRFKISILYTAILGLILIIYSSILYFSLQWTLYNDLDDELRIKAKAVSDAIISYMEVLGYDKETFLLTAKRVINKEGEYPHYHKIAELERQWLQKADKLDIESDYIDLLSPKREVLVSTGNLPKVQFSFLSKTIKGLSSADENFLNVRFEDRNLRVINKPILHNGERYIIQVATSLKPIIEILKERLIFTMATVPVILLLTSIIGRFLVAKILKPVKQITMTAKNLTHEDLGARVPIEQMDEEMRYLVNTFNGMIERLEKSFKHIAEFTSHVAHELKTPLAIMRGEIELALRKERTPAEYKRVIQGSLDEIHRILKIIEDLLLLSRIEHQPEVFKFERFAIEQFLTELYEQSRLLASQKNISVNFKLPGRHTIINADKVHLRRLLFNLISNAVKFTPGGGKIDIGLNRNHKKIFVSISDTGIGISRENLPKIFDKFFQTAAPDSNLEPSTGLGLSIALTIAKMHNGDIAVRSEPGKGSRFTVILPIA